MNPFKVLTFNIFKFGGRVDAERVVDRILELDPDVIGFQEVFNTKNSVGFKSRNASKILRRRLQDGSEGSPGAGYETVWQPSSGPGPFGFLVANRFSDGILLAAKTAAWDVSADNDYFATDLNDNLFKRRVIQGFVLRPKDGGGKVAVFNTHLTVGSKKRDQREKELTKALEFIAEVEDRQQPSATILMGDLNAVIQEVGDTLLARRPPRPRFLDTWKETNLDVDEREGNTIDLGNTLVQARPPKRRRESMRIDFIFVSPPDTPVVATRSRVVLNQRDPDDNLSDHYGVLTEFDFAG